MSAFITPALPEDAEEMVKALQAKGKRVVVSAFEPREYAKCPNCQDTQMVVVKILAKGPFKAPPNGLITWIDCEGLPAGWYMIEDTLVYRCPKCIEPEPKSGSPTQKTFYTREMLDELAKKKSMDKGG